MFDQTMIAWSKIISMLIFVPIYLGFLGYVFYRPNKEKLEAYGQIPLKED